MDCELRFKTNESRPGKPSAQALGNKSVKSKLRIDCENEKQIISDSHEELTSKIFATVIFKERWEVLDIAREQA